MRTATNPQTGDRLYYDAKTGKWEPLRTATNPETGDRLMFDGGKWVPLDEPEWSAKGIAQTAGALGSSALAGLGSAAVGVLNAAGGGSYERSQEVADEFFDYFSYKPTDEWAKQNMEGVAEFMDNPVFNALGEAGQTAGDYTYDKLNSNEYTDFLAPTAGMLAQLAPDAAAGYGTGAALRRGGQGLSKAAEEKIYAPLRERRQEKKRQKAYEQAVAPGIRDARDAGSMQTSAVREAVATAEGLPVPIPLTQGQATRNPRQYTREQELQKLEGGEDMGDFLSNQQRLIDENLERVRSVYDEGAAPVGLSRDAQGVAIKAALERARQQELKKKDELYKRAQETGDRDAPIDVEPIMKGFHELVDEDFDTLNPGVFDKLDKIAIKNGLRDGSATINSVERFRQQVNTHTDPIKDARLRQIVKRRVDEALDTAMRQGGAKALPAYKAARQAHKDYKERFYETDLASQIGTPKRGSVSDRTPDEKVFDKVRNASVKEMMSLRQALELAPGGKEMWQSFTQMVMADLIKKTRKGDETTSRHALKREIDALDDSGKLEVLFGKTNAQILRDISETADNVGVRPFGSFVNDSNTGSYGARMAQRMRNAPIGKFGVAGHLIGGIRDKGFGILDEYRVKKEIDQALNLKGLLDYE